MFDEPPKPVEDGYEFTLEQDSLSNAMGARLPNRSLWMIQGEVGSGKISRQPETYFRPLGKWLKGSCRYNRADYQRMD